MIKDKKVTHKKVQLIMFANADDGRDEMQFALVPTVEDRERLTEYLETSVDPEYVMHCCYELEVLSAEDAFKKIHLANGGK